MVYFVSSEVVGVVVADESFGESVKLIGSVEVHSADLNRLISGGSEGVSEGWDSGVEVLGIRPDFVLVRMLPGEHCGS